MIHWTFIVLSVFWGGAAIFTFFTHGLAIVKTGKVNKDLFDTHRFNILLFMCSLILSQLFP